MCVCVSSVCKVHNTIANTVVYKLMKTKLNYLLMSEIVLKS